MLFVHARTNSVVVQLHTIFLAVLIAAGVAFVATSPACIPPILHPQMTPRPVQHGGGVELVPCSTRSEPPSVLRMRADCGGRLFTAKFGVVMHYLPHQLLN